MYRKIPKISPWAFLRGLILEGLIFGGVYLRREICVSKSIVLALFSEGNLPVFQLQAPRGAYIWRGDLTEGFLRSEFGGLIFGGAYFRNFEVYLLSIRGNLATSFEETKPQKACLFVSAAV